MPMQGRTIYDGGFSAWAPRLLVPLPTLAAAPILLIDPNLSPVAKAATLAIVAVVGAACAIWLLSQQVSRIVVNAGRLHIGRPRLLSTHWQAVPETAFHAAKFEARGTSSRPLNGLVVDLAQRSIFIRLSGATISAVEFKRLCPSGFADYEAATGGNQHSAISNR